MRGPRMLRGVPRLRCSPGTLIGTIANLGIVESGSRVSGINFNF